MDKEDKNTARMRKELESLKKEEEFLKRQKADKTRRELADQEAKVASLKRQEADELRRELADQEAKVARLRGNIDSFKTESRNIDTKKEAACAVIGNELPVENNDVDIVKLRRSKKLRKLVNKQMLELALDDDFNLSDVGSSDEVGADSVAISCKTSSKNTKTKPEKSVTESDSQFSYDSSSDSDLCSSSSKKKKGKRSGIRAKASNSVKYPQKYPQAYLRFEFVSSNVSFEKIDLNLFVAGEIENSNYFRS